MSNDIGPLASMSHRPPATATKIAATATRPMPTRRTHRDCIARNGELAIRHQPDTPGRAAGAAPRPRPAPFPPPQAAEGILVFPPSLVGVGREGAVRIASAPRCIGSLASTVRKPAAVCLLLLSTAMLVGMSLSVWVTMGVYSSSTPSPRGQSLIS